MLCRLDGSRGPAAAAQRLRLPVLGGKYGPGKLSDAKGQAHSSLLSNCTAAKAASVEAPIEVPAGDVESSKGNADSSICKTRSGIHRTSSGKSQ